MIQLKELTEKQLFDICNIAIGGHLFSRWVKNVKEVETDDYQKRRKVQFDYTEDGFNVYKTYYFEIDSELKNHSWYWYSYTINKQGYREYVYCLDNVEIVDYCDENNINIRNK